jgi:hypothetical protein
MTFNPSTIHQHSLDMRQFIDFQQATLADGMRIIHAYNSSGLTFTLLPDRGLDIWLAHYKGLPLTWIAPGSPYKADFGAGWMRLYNGGLLTTCGLTHAGPAETDSQTGQRRDVHGNFSRLPAHNITIAGGWQDERYVLELRATITEAVMFGVQLRLTRAYRIILGQPGFELSDMIENLSDEPAPLMVLYHFNLGYPLVREGARLYTASEVVYPRDAAARAGQDVWPDYEAATPHYAEQVFFHHLRADENGFSSVALLNEDFGLQLEWDTATAPYFTQWKNARQGLYVSGIEPGNCIPEGQNTARESGRLVNLQPGERITFINRVRLIEGVESIRQCQQHIEALRRPAVGLKLGVRKQADPPEV